MHVYMSKRDEEKKTHSLTLQTFAGCAGKCTFNKWWLRTGFRFQWTRNAQTWHRTEESGTHSLTLLWLYSLFVNWNASTEESAFQFMHHPFSNISACLCSQFIMRLYWAMLYCARGINDESFNFNCSLIVLHTHTDLMKTLQQHRQSANDLSRGLRKQDFHKILSGEFKRYSNANDAAWLDFVQW